MFWEQGELEGVQAAAAARERDLLAASGAAVAREHDLLAASEAAERRFRVEKAALEARQKSELARATEALVAAEASAERRLCAEVERSRQEGRAEAEGAVQEEHQKRVAELELRIFELLSAQKGPKKVDSSFVGLLSIWCQV